MNSLLRLAFRNVLRNKRRSFLTAATVAIGTAFTVFTLSFIQGMFNGMVSGWLDAFGPVRVVTSAFAEREELQPLHENIPDVAPILEKIRALDGVKEAEPVIRTGVLVTLGEEMGEDPALLTGSSAAWFAAHVQEISTMLDGRWLDDEADDEQVVVGARVARDVGVRVGDEILLMGMSQYGSMSPISADVIGVISGDSTIDAQVFVTMETASWITDIPDGALEVLVYPDDPGDDGVLALTDRIANALGEEYVVRPWFERGMWVQMKPILGSMQYIFSCIIVFIMALAIFNTMTMSVLERTGEIGVMRAMGQYRLGSVVSFLLESLMIGICGGVVGALVGAIPAMMLERHGLSLAQEVVDDMGSDFPMSTTIHGDLSLELMVTAVVIGVMTAILGALLPALRAATIPPYEAMRSRR